jgi:serine/threonine protein kinase
MAPAVDHGLYLGVVLDNRFEVQEFRAEGGFSFVFKGFDRERRTDVAIKVLKLGANPSATLEFENEARLLQLLQQVSHVVDFIATGQGSIPATVRPGPGGVVNLPVPYTVLEYADAGLDELIVMREQLPFAKSLELFRHVVLGLHQMHAHGVVHRDLKAENCLVFERRGRGVVKLTDLGRSKRLSEPQRFAAEDYVTGRGDLRYAPPEFLWGQGWADETSMRRADLYLVGSVLFELVMGQAITAVAFGPGAAVNVARWARCASPDERDRAFRAMVKEVAARYQPVFSLFDAQIPGSVRQPIGQLLRQLCNSDPELREHRGRSGLADKDLDWVLFKTSRYIKQLAYAERSAAILAAKKQTRSGQ